MRVIVCIEMKRVSQPRFAQVCDLPVSPFPGLTIRAHVGDDVLQTKVKDVDVSTKSQMLVAYCYLDEGGGDNWVMDKFQADKHWKQFGARSDAEKNIKDGPSEDDCLEMMKWQGC